MTTMFEYVDAVGISPVSLEDAIKNAVEGISNPLKWRLPWIPHLCVRRSKQDYRWNAKRSSEMGRPTVVADK